MEQNRIYNEDCLLTLQKMESNSIDMVVTSPPYNFGGFNRNKRVSCYDTYSDDMPENDYRKWIGKILDEISRILIPGGTLYWNHKGRFVDGVYKPVFWVVDICPLQLYQHIVWKYPSSPDVAKIKFYPRHEEIFMFTKGKPAYFNEEMAEIGDVWEISHIQKNDHPAPFPFNLARRAINASCKRGGVVYDPFMGSGTTALAAIDLGMNYIGSEISSNYCEYANRRIQQKVSQLSLF